MLATGQAASGSVVVAQQQTAGRGQRGRHWQSSTGGLYLSLAIEPNWAIQHAPQLTCLSAWGIATALRNLGIDIKIKWPNDLLFRGKKLGGILTETKLATSKPDAVRQTTSGPDTTKRAQTKAASSSIKQAVVGVGINWHNEPPETGISLAEILEDTSLKIAKSKINCLEMLIALVLRGILQGVVFQQQVGSQVFMKAYQKLLTQVGQTVSLDSSGKLSLATPLACAAQPTNSTGSSHQPPSSELHSKLQWANRSGEVVGVSEEGYLKVALHRLNQSKTGHSAALPENILWLKPSEIHIS